MTTTTMTERSARRSRPPTRVGRRAPQTAVFTAAIAVAVIHVLDDAFVHREPGVGPGQHLLAAVVSLVLGLGAVYAFPHLRPAARSALGGLLRCPRDRRRRDARQAHRCRIGGHE